MGEHFGDIELEIGAYNTVITNHQKPTASAVGDAPSMSTDDTLTHPHCLIGSADFMRERLILRREAYGIPCICVLDDGQNRVDVITLNVLLASMSIIATIRPQQGTIHVTGRWA